MGKFNLSEAAKEVLDASVASKRGGQDKPARLQASVAYGTKDVGKIGDDPVDNNAEDLPNYIKGVPSATPPGATPPVGQQPRPQLSPQPQQSAGRGDLVKPVQAAANDYASLASRVKAKLGPQTFQSNPGATFQSYSEEVEVFEEYSDEEMIDMLFSEEYDLDEAISKSGYVELARRVSDPEYNGTTDHDDVVARARKVHGDKFANDLESGARKMHFGRDNHKHGFDKLNHRINRSMTPSHVTKSGMLTKSSQKGLKSSLKEEEKEGHEDAAQDKKMMKAMMKKKMKEDMDALMQGENLSEEFVSKATTIFEAAVNARAEEVISEVEDALLEEFQVAVENIKEEMAEKVDSYLNYMVEEWVKENELAIEKGLRAEIVEEFIEGLRDLFVEHYIDIPKEKVDIVDELAEHVNALEEALNEEISRGVQLMRELNEHKKHEAIYEACEGLSQTQVEKLKSLTESVEFTTEEEFAEKVGTLKEAYFKSDVKVASNSALDDELLVEDEEVKPVRYDDPSMEVYAKTISKTVIK